MAKPQMVGYEQALSSRRGRNKKPALDHLRVYEAENGGHVVEHHFQNGMGPYTEEEHNAFGKHTGAMPQLPEGHVLHHIAKHINIPHETIAAEAKAEGESKEYEAEERE